ncbi:MAG TPA: hypothetical protein VHD69_03035 [Candidatus Paceibacterota bacterium]|nr:hypothetical protein [Candidatus Paceibacterota bacterium]
MEPENINPDSKNKDLADEGIDIVGTSQALDNEFSKPELSSDAPTMPDTALDAESREPVAPEPIAPAPVTTPPVPKPAAVEDPRPIRQAVPPVNRMESPAPRAPENQPKNDPSIKPIRTFKSDAEEAVRYGGVSKIGIAVAEQNRRDAKPIEYVEERRVPVGLFIGIVAILILFLGGGWYIWFSMSGGTKNPVVSTPAISYTPIIPYSQASIVVLDPNDTDKDPMELIAAKLGAANPGVGNVFALIPVPAATAGAPESIANVLNSTHIPSRLVRSLADNYMFGLYSYDKQAAFMILKNSFFQNAFSGMLDWEKSLGEDLIPLIRVTYPEMNANSLAASFEDAVVSNIDVRTLKDATGRLVLAYAFADKDTIVVATTENSLKYLLDRILQVRTIQ